MNVLVDSSVWRDHFRRTNAALVQLLTSDRVLTHPMVIVELACAAPSPPARRARTFGELALLNSVRPATLHEVHDFIEREQLYGQGGGLVDFVLLCSALITPNTALWTLDPRLRDWAVRFGISHGPAH